ncbi:hypothetical protein KG112_17485 [Nocardioides sp. zg-ZUI104]|uniref:hypothetical protein n=1 Tax=Nocardioides faecalis TaxID=2803858 RepID=UPI001BCFEB77|nr:hypothetical protein [Nocardioides faecalis]MBS4754603.1 hypothetical protein [Nocardioides faecalis]
MLEELSPWCENEERCLLARAYGVEDPEALKVVLEEAMAPQIARDDGPYFLPGEPTTDLHVDRAMRRLGFRPTNPDSEPYDVFEEMTRRGDGSGAAGH